MTLQGYPVLGRVADTPAIAQKVEATQIIVAIPSATAEEIVSIHRTCKPAGLPMKVLPSLAELVSGRVSLRDARDLDIRIFSDGRVSRPMWVPSRSVSRGAPCL
jgi:FlaA1/EpsC-like NDP-sugar epimerase